MAMLLIERCDGESCIKERPFDACHLCSRDMPLYSCALLITMISYIAGKRLRCGKTGDAGRSWQTLGDQEDRQIRPRERK